MSTPEQRMRRELERLRREHGRQVRGVYENAHESQLDREIDELASRALSAADKCPRCGQSGVCSCP